MARAWPTVRITIAAARDIAVVARLRFLGLGHAVGTAVDRQAVTRLRRRTAIGILRRAVVALAALSVRLDLKLAAVVAANDLIALWPGLADRKSTRLNSSH